MQTKKSFPHAHSLTHHRLLQARARGMCFHPTATEALLFSAIRGKRLGVAFRRQQIIGNHIVDFLAREISLVVEVDGDIYHARRISADLARERKLVRAGYTVVRVPASIVQNNLTGAVAVVQKAVFQSKAAS